MMPQELPGTHTYEVFIQPKRDSPLAHVGSVVAVDPESAWRAAGDAFGRRDDVVQLWVASRSGILVSGAEDLPLLAGATRMPHRHPAYALARQKVLNRPEPSEVVYQTLIGDDGALWVALADDLFLHAHHLSAMFLDYVELEGSLSLGSIAQEDLAHARALAELAGIGTDQIDAHFFDRADSEWAPSALVRNGDDHWPSVVARGLVLTAALVTVTDRRFRAYADGADQPRGEAGHSLRALEVVNREQKVHLQMWREWTEGLLADKEVKDEFRDVLVAALDAGADLMSSWPHRWSQSHPDVTAHREIAVVLGSCGIDDDRLAYWPDFPKPRSAVDGQSAAVLADIRFVRSAYRSGAII